MHIDLEDCTLKVAQPIISKPNINSSNSVKIEPYSWAWNAWLSTPAESLNTTWPLVNNLPVNYVQHNIWQSSDTDLEWDDGQQERDTIKDTRFQARKILNKIKNGKDEDLIFVAENDQIGDRKVNLATKEDRQYLEEHFAKPLKKLCLRRSIANRDIDPETFWSTVMSAHGKDWSKVATEEYWKQNTFWLDIHNTDKFAKQMKRLWEMYVQYNTQTSTNKSFGNNYVQQVVGMMDNYVRYASDQTDFNNWKKGIKDIYIRNNNASKNLTWVAIYDGKRDEEKAKSSLNSLDSNIFLESQLLTTNHRQSAVETYNVKQLVDNAVFFGKYNTTNEEWFANFLGDTSFSGGLDNSDMWLRGWQQILAQFRIAVEQYAYNNNINLNDRSQLKVAQTAILKNILTFAATKSLRDWNDIIYKVLQPILTKNVIDLWASMIGNKESNASGSNSVLSQHPGILKYLQNTLIESPGDTDAIMLYGDKTGASYTSLNVDKILASENLNTLDPERKQIIETVLSNPANAAELKKYMDKYNNTGISQEQMLANIAEAVYGSIKWTSPLSINTNWPSFDKKVGKVSLSVGAGLWTSIELAKHARLNMGMATNGSSVMPAISLSFDQDIGKWWKIWETVSLLPPWVWLALAKNRQSQKSITAINKTLDTKAIVNYTVWADANLTYDGTGGLAGLNASAWIGFFKEKDYLGGIDKWYQERKTTAEGIIGPIIEELKNNVKNNVYPDSKVRKSELLTVLNKKYKDSDKATLDLMAENLMNSMAYFGCTDLKNIDDAMIKNLAQWFAAERKENAIKELKDRKLTWFWLRLGASLSPFEMAKIVLTLWLSFKISNFSKGFHYEDSAESIMAVKNANELGIGNRQLDTISDVMWAREVEFMNRIFATTHHRMNDYALDPISMSSDGRFVAIPQWLRDAHAHVNLKLDPSLKWQIKIENGNLFVPANAPMRVSAHAGTSGVEYVLSLWSHFDKPDAVHLIKGRQLPTDRQASTLDAIHYVSPLESANKNPLTVTKISDQITSLRQSNIEAYKDFNLSVISSNSKKVVLSGISVDQIALSSPIKVDINGQIIVDAWSQLMVSKWKDGKFVLSAIPTANQFSLVFENKQYTSEGLTVDSITTSLKNTFGLTLNNPTLTWTTLTYTNDQWQSQSVDINDGKIGDVSLSMSGSDLVLRTNGWSSTGSQNIGKVEYLEVDTDIEKSAMEDLDKALTNSTIRGLFESLEESQKSNFYLFMGHVMDRNTTEASSLLQTMLDKNQPLKNKVSGLYASLDQDLRTQQLIIARMLTVFALEPDKKWIPLHNVFKLRQNTYQTVGSPSGQKLDFINRSMIEDWYKDVKFTDAKDTTSYDDILWYTAFYRKNAKGNQKWYALTAPWYTRVVWDKIIDIASKDESKAKEAMNWLIANIEKDDFAQKAIISALEKKFTAVWLSLTFTKDTVISLLRGDSIIIDNKTISVKAKPIFYLCAECANESLGLQIESISVSDNTSGKEVKISWSLWEGISHSSQVIDFDTKKWNSFAINTVESNKNWLATTGEKAAQFGVTAGIGVGENGNNKKFNDGKWDSHPWWNNNPTNLPWWNTTWSQTWWNPIPPTIPSWTWWL
jgi:hypothetical protein